MSSIPFAALNTRASKPGSMIVPISRLNNRALTISSCRSEMSAGVILSTTSAAVNPSMRSAPGLKIWITPLRSVAMREMLALERMACCKASAIAAPVPTASTPAVCGAAALRSLLDTDSIEVIRIQDDEDGRSERRPATGGPTAVSRPTSHPARTREPGLCVNAPSTGGGGGPPGFRFRPRQCRS